MRYTIEVDIKDCRDCYFKHNYYGHGECWSECNHPDNGRGAYENILWGCRENFSGIPDWCPIMRGE